MFSFWLLRVCTSTVNISGKVPHIAQQVPTGDTGTLSEKSTLRAIYACTELHLHT